MVASVSSYGVISRCFGFFWSGKKLNQCRENILLAVPVNIRDSFFPGVLDKNMSTNPKKEPIFVVQKHDASHLHYDVRLEIGGVLKSWAVPKGPPLKFGEKRLAILQPDHDINWAKFEGVIPEGQYGAGTVEKWDSGSYKNLKTQDMQQCFESGAIEVKFSGKKLDSSYALVKTKLGDGKNENWLLFKIKKD